MTDCSICLDVLRNPVSIPCGHILCEKCLRGHIRSGADALKSACPTCRKPFFIATPDLAFVPQKYHDFILPSVRKIYMDIPSVSGLEIEIEALTQRLGTFAKENEHLRQRCMLYRERVVEMSLEKRAIIEQEEDARQEAIDLRKKYHSLKRKYRETQSRGDAFSTVLSCTSIQNLNTPQENIPKEEEHPVSLREPNALSRPKRALPKSRLSNGTCHKDDQRTKRQRTHRHSDEGSTSGLQGAMLKYEDEDE